MRRCRCSFCLKFFNVPGAVVLIQGLGKAKICEPCASNVFEMMIVERRKLLVSDVWWEVLGVEQDASDREIRSAYRRVAKIAHGDRGGDDHLMASLNAARDAALKSKLGRI